MRRVLWWLFDRLIWIIMVGMVIGALAQYRNYRLQNRAMHGMAGAVVHVGTLAIEQDKRIDGYDALLPSIFKTDKGLMDSMDRLTNEVSLLAAEVRALRQEVEALKSRSAPQYFFDPMPNPSPWNFPTNWQWNLTNGFGTNIFFYVTTPATIENSINQWHQRINGIRRQP